MTQENPKSILICGESGHGKSASLLGIKDREDVLYLNCEAGKPLPFKNKFKKKTITDPDQVLEFIEELAELGDQNPFNFVVIDTVSFMMDMFERQNVIGASNTMKMWGEYALFFPRIMDATAKVENTFFIFLGHLDSFHDEDEGITKYKVPVKGSLATKGLEAFFTTVIYVKRMRVKDIEKAIPEGNNLLNISEKDRARTYKHVFLTEPDKNTIGGRIRSPLGMWSDDELYIDNDVQHVIKRLIEYYSDN